MPPHLLAATNTFPLDSILEGIRLALPYKRLSYPFGQAKQECLAPVRLLW
jgi:hypothetical protein